MEPFRPFGVLHATTVGVVFLVVALAAWWGARQPLDRARLAGRGLGLLLLAYYLVESVVRVQWLGLDPTYIWPLEICNALFFIGAAALWWSHRQGFAIVTLWTFTCTLQAFITPTPGAGYPSLEYVRYFTNHGLLVLAAVYVLVGLAARPTAREAVGAALALQCWEVFVGLVDWVTGENFLYLRFPPPSPTLIDFLGPWPWYILSLEAVGVASFALWYGVFKLAGRVTLTRQPETALRAALATAPAGKGYDLNPPTRA